MFATPRVRYSPRQTNSRHSIWCRVLFAVALTQSMVFADDPTLPFEGLLQHRVGFAEAVTGGARGELVVIDKLDFSMLRDALADDKPRWIRFKPGLKGEIELDGNLFIGSNKTIDGRGADITITSPGDCDEILFWGKDKDGKVDPERRNLIVHNIKIIKVGKGDNCGQGLGIAYGAKDVWVDHVTFSGNGDESLSMGKGATNLTVSWCRFSDTDKAILLSWGSGEEDARRDPAMRVTIHHSYFLRVNGRSPALRFGKVHCFNNFVKHWNWSGVEVTMNGELFSENNIYGRGRWDNSPPALKTDANKWSPQPGFIRSVGDRFLNVDGIDGQGPGINQPDRFVPRYKYHAESPDDGFLSRLQKHTGWSSNPQWPHSKKIPSSGSSIRNRPESKRSRADENSADAPAAAKPGALRAVSYNVQFLPGLARYTNERGEPAYRAKQIAEKMSAFDIVGLNETFDNAPRKLIHDGIRERWGKDCHILFGPDPQDGRFNGGLSLLSRFPLVEDHSVVYRNFSTPEQYGLGADGFAAKGVLHARVALPAGRFTKDEVVDVFVTHFEARDGSLRRKQFDELAAFMSKHTSASRLFLLLGDLNTRGNAKYRAAENSTYNRLFGVLRKSLPDHNIVDAWPARYPEKDGGTKYQTKPTGGPRIDYIVVGNAKKHATALHVDDITVNPHLDEKVMALSDHSAVEATLQVDKSEVFPQAIRRK